MKSPYKIIKSPLISEKLQVQQEQGVYGFWVEKDANKIEIGRAIKEIYNVIVTRVNVVTVPGKKRRIRFKQGHTPQWKKALITLKKGHTITIT